MSKSAEILATQAALIRRVLDDQAPDCHWCVLPSEPLMPPQIIIEYHGVNGGWRDIWSEGQINEAFIRRTIGDTPLNERGFDLLASLADRAKGASDA